MRTIVVITISLIFISSPSFAFQLIYPSPSGQYPVEEVNHAWETFFAAVTVLQDDGDRVKASKLFRECAKKYPDSEYAKDSKELGKLLAEMVKEDEKWREPENVNKLDLQKRIDYYIYHLRDVNCHQMGQPGACTVFYGMLGQFEFESYQKMTNAAIEFHKIGMPAVPALIELLEDRRPTRSVGYFRYGAKSRTVLRNQDAAIQILHQLSPMPLQYCVYFSIQSPENQTKTIDTIKVWYEKVHGKSKLERLWLTVDLCTNLDQALPILEDLAEKPGQKAKVIEKLHKMAEESNPFHVPQISYTLCKLGDRSKLAEVFDACIAGKYHDLPEPSATGLGDPKTPTLNDDQYYAKIDAGRYAIRQILFYGDGKTDGPLPINAFNEIHPMLRQICLYVLKNCFYSTLEEYERQHFPFHILIELLNDKGNVDVFSNYNKKWYIRDCDRAAERIQEITEIDFGYDRNLSIEQKDTVIEKIRKWWQIRTKEKQPDNL